MLPRRIVFAGLAVVLFVAPARADNPAQTRPLRVAVYADAGTSKSLDTLVQALAARPDFAVQKVTAQDVRDGKLAGFDVLVHPGGSGSGQGKALGEDGRAKVKDFVKAGKGYVGVCAGAYLASADYPWSLHILDAKVVDRQHWARGFGTVDIAVAPGGKDVLGVSPGPRPIYYHQGPLLAPAGKDELPDYEPLATFAGEIAKNGAPRGVMPGTTAIAAGRFGGGRVLCFSPHPERTEELHPMLQQGVRWAAGR